MEKVEAIQIKSNKKFRAIYVRVSTRDQVINGNGLEAQIDRIQSYLKFKDIDESTCRYYVEEGKSARTINRPKLEELLNDVKTNKVEEVIFYKLDRVIRSVVDFYTILKIIIDHNCGLHCVVDTLDIRTANGLFLCTVLAAVAQLESGSISERTNDGLYISAKNGNYIFGGKPPFGYKRVDGSLVIYEKEASVIRLIYDLAVRGNRGMKISHILANEYDYYMNHNRIDYILRQKLYIGKLIFKGIEYACNVPKIIDEEVFFLAHERKHETKYSVNDYTFRNVIYCYECKKTADCKVTNKPQKKYLYYYCSCCKRRINENLILSEIYFDLIKNLDSTIKNVDESKFIKLHEKINKKINELYLSYVSNKIDIDTYGCAIKNLKNEKKKIDNKLKALMMTAKVRWNAMGSAEKNEFILSTYKRIYVDYQLKIIIKIEKL